MAVIAIAFFALIVNGETPTGKTDAHKQNRANAVQPSDAKAGRTVIVVNQHVPEGKADDHAKEPPSYLSRLFSPENLPSIALVIVAGFTLLAIWYQAQEMTKATKVMKDSVDAQKRQANLLESQISLMQPRLHVDGVRVIEFEEGRQPIFFVKVMNSGVVAAEKVSISIIVELGDSTIQYPADQVIIIPANNWRECFIHDRRKLDGTLL